MLKSLIVFILFISIAYYIASLFLIPVFLYFVFQIQMFYRKIFEKYNVFFSQFFLKRHQKSIIGHSQSTSLPFSGIEPQHQRKTQVEERQQVNLAFREVMDVLIPAHNEQNYLSKTVESIRRAFTYSGRECRIIIGLDHCEDQTLEVASAIGDVVVSVQFESKWQTLNYLVQFVKSDWVGFVDVGTIWPEELILKFSEWEQKREILFVAPSYQQQGSSVLQKLNWELESFLKNIENTAGGPISVHGATVFYKCEPLKQTLNFLDYKKKWLNDDVIIPLVLRAQNKKSRGIYLYQVKVTDLPPLTRNSQRRSRISMGNLEILEFLNNGTLKLNGNLKMLWGRRKARIFWAYLLLSTVLLIGVLNSWNSLFINSLIILFLAFSFSRRVFRASLMAPFYFMKLRYRDNSDKSSFGIKWH